MTRATDHIIVMENITPAVRSKPKPAPKMKRANNPPIDKAAYLEFRHEMGWGILCDCGCEQIGTTLHHCIIGRRKGYVVLDDFRNYALVNMWEDNTRKFDNPKWRKFFYELNKKRFYPDVMQMWIAAVLAAGIDKSRLDFLR